MAECLAPEDPASAERHVMTAMQILGRIGARNELARAMMTRAALRQAAGDPITAQQQLDQAEAIFRELGTLGEPVLVEAARAALDSGAAVRLGSAFLVGASLRGADLRGAYVRRANLDGADLSDADLCGAECLMPDQLDRARCTNGTKLPGAFREADDEG
jgi:uncharacterized protein YjbI with pentapeptide repeats